VNCRSDNFFSGLDLGRRAVPSFLFFLVTPVLHILTVIRWPLEFAITFSYIACAPGLGILFAQIGKPASLFGFGGTFHEEKRKKAIGWTCCFRSSADLLPAMRDSAGEASDRFVPRASARSVWLSTSLSLLHADIFFLKPGPSGNFDSDPGRSFFSGAHAHVLVWLIAAELVGFAGYLVYVVRLCESRTAHARGGPHDLARPVDGIANQSEKRSSFLEIRALAAAFSTIGWPQHREPLWRVRACREISIPRCSLCAARALVNFAPSTPSSICCIECKAHRFSEREYSTPHLKQNQRLRWQSAHNHSHYCMIDRVRNGERRMCYGRPLPELQHIRGASVRLGADFQENLPTASWFFHGDIRFLLESR